MNYASPIEQPVFSTAARWSLRVLAWLAFAVSAYLAWHAIGQTSSLAGCGAGSATGCDEVLSSSWSKWLGIPVAIIGLACYATLAALSVLLGIESSPLSRWVRTAFVTGSVAAAGASLWFLGVQIVALGKYCPYCLLTDLCGIALGSITLWSVGRWFVATRSSRRLQNSGAGLMALRSALPVAGGAGPHPAPVVAAPRSAGPLLPHAIGGGIALLFLLVAGQILFPTKTYSSVNTTLDQPIDLDGTDISSTSNGEYSVTASPNSHVAMRIPTDATIEHRSNGTKSSDPSPGATSADGEEAGSDNVPPASDPNKQRIVEFLNGSVKLDIYQHAHIGSPEAPHVMVEMISYDCSHCRKMHRTIKRGLARYGDQLAVIVIPVPMEMQCNPLVTAKEVSHAGACTIARMALGVAAVRPDLFEKFHEFLMADPEAPPQQSVVVSKAYHTVDASRLSELSDSQQLQKRIADYITLYSRLGRQTGTGKDFGLPVQILGNQLLTGSVEKESDVFDAWEKHLGVVRN
jgi:uncharacterized membrane protein